MTDTAVLLPLSIVALAGHRLAYLLHQHPYWADEAWVAVLSRAPLSQWVSLSSSTPLGWLLLVRLVPDRDALRIVPLVFLVGDVIAAYAFARLLQWGSALMARAAGLAAALMVLLAPATLFRNDLKQYTADAFVALVLLTIAASLDRRRDRRVLIGFAAASILAVLLSTTSVFVTTAVFASLLAATMFAAPRSELRTVMLCGAAAGVTLTVFTASVLLPHDNPALRHYWNAWYLRGGLADDLHVTWLRLVADEHLLAMPALVFVTLVTAGCVVLWRLGHHVVAVAVPLLWVEMFVLGVAARYPFLDARTSHFLFVVSLAVAAVGVIGLLHSISLRSPLVAGGLAVIGAAALWFGAVPAWRSALPNEDVRSQTLYVAAHRSPRDGVVVSLQSTYAFAFYWPAAHREYQPDRSGTFSNGFDVWLAHQPGIEFADGDTTASVDAAIRRAFAYARAHGGEHVWIVRSHLAGPERTAFNVAVRRRDVITETLDVGPNPLIRLDLVRTTDQPADAGGGSVSDVVARVVVASARPRALLRRV
jgi:hypothetical protein